MTEETKQQNVEQAKAHEDRIIQFDRAISRIARHVGACCGGVDVKDDNGKGSHTDQEIIRKIDELYGLLFQFVTLEDRPDARWRKKVVGAARELLEKKVARSE